MVTGEGEVSLLSSPQSAVWCPHLNIPVSPVQSPVRTTNTSQVTDNLSSDQVNCFDGKLSNLCEFIYAESAWYLILSCFYSKYFNGKQISKIHQTFFSYLSMISVIVIISYIYLLKSKVFISISIFTKQRIWCYIDTRYWSSQTGHDHIFDYLVIMAASGFTGCWAD